MIQYNKSESKNIVMKINTDRKCDRNNIIKLRLIWFNKEKKNKIIRRCGHKYYRKYAPVPNHQVDL